MNVAASLRMKHENRSQRLTRDSILKLISDDEVAKANGTQRSTLLSGGDEYVNLDQLKDGVRRALSESTPREGSVVAKGSVHHKTWDKILIALESYAGT